MGQIFFHVVKGEPFQLARGEQTSRAHMLFARVELNSDFEKKRCPRLQDSSKNVRVNWGTSAMIARYPGAVRPWARSIKLSRFILGCGFTYPQSYHRTSQPLLVNPLGNSLT